MLICIPDVLDKAQVAHFRDVMSQADMGGRPLDRRRAILAGEE